ncbi:transposase [Streptomyces sp. NPDC091368]|uniref:transposase n=1 Tax=Streptomyces sp. NPDC091368 TaxID=3365993 RepID=UPI00380A1781
MASLGPFGSGGVHVAAPKDPTRDEGEPVFIGTPSGYGKIGSAHPPPRLQPGGRDPPGRPGGAVVALHYDVPRIAHLLSDLPVGVQGRLRSDRVVRKPVPVPWICPPQSGRPPRHGGEFAFGAPATWGEATKVAVTNTDRYETATAQAWDRLHPRLPPSGGMAPPRGPAAERAKTATPAGAPKPTRPGPGRPLDCKNRQPAPG